LSESDEAFHVGVARVYQQDESSFTSRAFAKGAAIGRYDLNVLLDGSRCRTDLYGLYMTSGRQHMDNFINIEHTKPQSTSSLYYKGILDGHSRAVFGGTVLVRKEAQKTESIQSDKNLVLSPDAEVDSKPALFIYADDVKCGHGATAGNVDPDTVFYMRSRGLDLETASRLLIYGFADEIIDKVELSEFRSYLQTLFLESLPKYKFEFD
jgi:Fe-S cluster assembly protein SufD